MRTKTEIRRLAEYGYRISKQDEPACRSCRWYDTFRHHCEVIGLSVDPVGTCIAWRQQQTRRSNT